MDHRAMIRHGPAGATLLRCPARRDIVNPLLDGAGHFSIGKGSRMNILSVEKISKSYGTKRLFSELSFGIAEGDKIGLIGVNGTGKTTLLRILVGQEPADSGQVVYANQARIGYLPQNPLFDPDSSVLEAAIQGTSAAMKLVREYERQLQAVAAQPGDPALQEELLRLGQRMDEAGTWQLESEAKTILTKLGIQDFAVRVGTLSGGQRKRIALAAALINPVELLILDEPTNQIDNQTVDWLEQYLRQRSGALLMVTHDRYFLDRVTNRILELNEGKAYSYTGNYSLFLAKKAELEELEQALAAKRQNLYRRELAWIRRGAKARSTKQQARIERFEDLQAQMGEASSHGQLEMTAGASRLGKKVILIEGLGKSFAGRTVIRDFSHGFQRGDRVGIIGPNGIGKSTLLQLIAGNLQPDQGVIERGPTVKLGFFTQEHLEMDESLRVIDFIKAVAEHLPTADGGTISASQMLERFLFPPALQWTPIARMSGGEKRRLYLLRVLMAAPNVLLLDEPTNDLDVQTLSILEEYLEEFPGVVIAVSHDRYFLDRIAGKLLVFETSGRILSLVGNYSDYLEYQRRREEAEAQEGTAAGPPLPVRPRTEGETAGKARPVRLSYMEQRELEGIEPAINQVEQELAAVNAKIVASGSDYLLLQELTAAQAELGRRLEEFMERWAYLTERAEQIAKNKT
ncbi:ATP-binding cassette subfamily F protein uup [Hydrogenispora ethanolica]|uniref:ATP-binding cassette subfamily F protein uup n=2 Tax=Hydrogenispora ethanolica TaxID=1082276 RepID=A0A4R1RY13_HYDET|nr:ATP-binding cassette subfamily F protein uup [Hydrogenispora ethanolica]